MGKLKKLKNALWNIDGFWAIIGSLATIIVGLDFLTLAFAGNPAWYGAFVFLMVVVGTTAKDGSKVIKRYKEETKND